LQIWFKWYNTGLAGTDVFHTIHNYIDTDEIILRKGAIAAHKGEKVLIPINMRDRSVLAIGKGNSEWNYSAPHGVGRVMSRTKAKTGQSIIFLRKKAGLTVKDLQDAFGFGTPQVIYKWQ